MQTTEAQTVERPTITTRPAKLEDRLREACRVRHYALTTERVYVSWYKQFVPSRILPRWAGSTPSSSAMTCTRMTRRCPSTACARC